MIVNDVKQNTSREIDSSESDFENDTPVYDYTNQAKYIKLCGKLNVVPSSLFIRLLESPVMDMSYYSLSHSSLRAMSITLASNSCVSTLNLSNNSFGPKGGEIIMKMMTENIYITELNLSDNKITDEVAPFLRNMIEQNEYLTHLNLSGNEFTGKTMEVISEPLMFNQRIKYLNLSKNKLDDAAGLHLGAVIKESSLLELDISWNSIVFQGIDEIAKGLKKNMFMKKLDISFNKISTSSADCLGQALRRNNVIEEISLINTQLSLACANLLAPAIAQNESLKIIRFGENPMGSKGCVAIATAVAKSPKSAIKLMDFNGTMVMKDDVIVMNATVEERKDIKFEYSNSEDTYLH